MKSNKTIKSLLALVVAGGIGMAAVAAPKPAALTGDKAKAKFPAEMQKFKIETASWAQLMPGVEYMYAHFTDLYGYPDDAHFIKIDFAKAPLKMKIHEGALCKEGEKLALTSAVAKQHDALFAINGNMFRWNEKPNYRPYYLAKVDGKIVDCNCKGGSGIAFNDDKTWTMGNWNEKSAEPWQNVHTCENILKNGKCTLEGEHWKAGKPSAGFPFLGMTTNKILWVAVVDGRRQGISPGITYYNAAGMMAALGCDFATLYDGGGSTTLVIRKDLLPSTKLAPTQHVSEGSKKHVTMNFTNTNGKDQKERAVVDQLCFVAMPKAEKGKSGKK